MRLIPVTRAVQVPKHEGQHHRDGGEWRLPHLPLPRHRLQVHRGLRRGPPTLRRLAV